MSSNHLILCHPPSSCRQSFPASGSFLMSWLFTSRGQFIGASASASVLLMIIQDQFPFRLTGLISLQSKSLLQHHSSKASVLQRSAFFMVQLSHPYMTTGKTIHLTRWNILQARILEWVVIPSSRGSSQLRDQTQFSHTAGRFFTI